MGKILKKVVCLLAVAVISVSLAACSSNIAQKTMDNKAEQPEKKEIKIACMSHTEDVVNILREGLAPLGYDVKVVMFDGTRLPATALKDGFVDGLVLNNLPWLKTFNKENNCDLQMPKPYMYYGREAIYSSKHKTIGEIPQNAQIVIPGDPSNKDKSLLLLRDLGLITLGEKTGNFYTLLNIEHNPKNIKIIEADMTQTIRSINDVDAVISTANNARKAGIDPNVFLYEDPSKVNYPLGLVVNAKDVEAEWVKAALAYTQTEEFKNKFNKYYNGVNILYNN